MRDCAEAKSRPAGPACCLRDCKLSLRMQTDMQDRHHLPVLPSSTETAAQRVAPLLPLRASLVQAYMHVYEVPSSVSSACIPATSRLSLGLFSVWKSESASSRVSALKLLPPCHCSMVHWLSMGGSECLDSFPCFTSLTV